MKTREDDERETVAADRTELKGKEYERELKRLHVELVKLQEWVRHKGLKVCILFEGRDGAGKGGTIKAITERVSPRVFRVIALPTPTEREQSQMYIQRYLPHLPAAREIVIFDRSWYNRAGVERVMGFCTEDQVKNFLQLAPLVEKTMVDSGIILLKYWLEVSPEEQTRRLEARIDDGRKIWKLSPMDLKSYSRWYDYSRARDEMFAATDTSWAPWFVMGIEQIEIEHRLDFVPDREASPQSAGEQIGPAEVRLHRHVPEIVESRALGIAGRSPIQNVELPEEDREAFREGLRVLHAGQRSHVLV